MPYQNPFHQSLLQQFETYLREEHYHAHNYSWYVIVARRFLCYLEKRKIAAIEAQPTEISAYLHKELKAYRRRYGHSPHHIEQWRCQFTSAIHHVLRLAQGKWPPEIPPGNAIEAFQRQVCKAYEYWLAETRGLAQPTLKDRKHRAQEFLCWLGEGGNPESLKHLTVSDIDAYLEWRTPSLRRTTRKSITTCLRCLLRYLYMQGIVTHDLASAVSSPTLYAYEGIPVTLREQDIQNVLDVTHKDTTPIGRRDYAILMLLATYGLRAGEIVRLCLEDVDWRQERLRIRHTKTGTESFLPLLEPVGNALLDYLQYGRPQTKIREIFLRARPPYRPFASGSSLYSPISRRLMAAGISCRGKHGPHAFRHACAVKLLKAAVSTKTIGDILGHCCANSTSVYLKLATEDLRTVGLDVPKEVTK